VSTYTTSLRRVVIFTTGVAVGLFSLSGVASAAPTKAQGGNVAHTSANPDNLEPQPASTADFTGHGANVHGAYDSTRDGSPSGNGNGKGNAVGKPCAGCVGKADNKNPKGQAPNGSDHNAGYECDRNHGIGRSNPAHTGCTTSTPPVVGGDNDSDNSGSDGSGSGSTPADSDQGPTVSSDKPGCADGPMTTDVNGDGIVNEADCASVLGSTVDRAAPAAVTPAASGVLGSAVLAGSAFRPVQLGASVAQGPGALPRTGLDLSSSILVGLLCLAAGLVLVRKAELARR
jgi:hypothetical protein